MQSASKRGNKKQRRSYRSISRINDSGPLATADPNICNYSPTNRVLIPEKEQRRNFDIASVVYETAVGETCGRGFDMDVRDEVPKKLYDQQKTFYEEGIQKLEARWTKCNAQGGDYIEK
ncbi:hypothetical protein TNCV_3738371 [Trichonephila clavipes]|nr:hypothetical protein TNCV_3738371 [Trichonephila clavipes]